MTRLVDRRTLVKGACGLAMLALLPPGLLHATEVEPRVVDLAVSPTRSTKLTIWAPAAPKGVVLFSTGHGSWPERYARLVDLLVSSGFAVLAPLHVDSMRYPERDKFTVQQSLPERLADLRATGAYAAKTYPGLPLVAAGHSFGSLMALCQGGALSNMGPFRNPAVKAVLAFSSPGKIPGLIGPNAYAGVAVPMMMVTGTADTIPAAMGYPTVPADHLLAAETTPSGSYALVVDGGDHVLVDDAARFAHVAAPVRLFIEAYGLGNAAARASLQTWRPAEGDRWVIRESKA